MPKYQLSDDQKERLCSIVDGLTEGYIDREWTVAYGGERILGIFGLQDKENTGKLWRDVWSGVTFADFADFVECGFFRVSGYDTHGQPSSYLLHKQRIIDACEGDFEIPASVSLVNQTPQRIEGENLKNPIVFISHMHKDKSIATILESFVKKSIVGEITVFNTSNRHSIAPGDPWRDQIINNLKASSVLLVIATPKSVYSPWVNFESGGAWTAGSRVIPCCIDGMTPDTLPSPLRDLQAVDLQSKTGLNSLAEIIAQMTQLALSPDIYYENAVDMFQEVIKAKNELDDADKDNLPPQIEAFAVLDEIEARLKIRAYEINEDRGKKRDPAKWSSYEQSMYEIYLDEVEDETHQDIDAIQRIRKLLSDA